MTTVPEFVAEQKERREFEEELKKIHEELELEEQKFYSQWDIEQQMQMLMCTVVGLFFDSTEAERKLENDKYKSDRKKGIYRRNRKTVFDKVFPKMMKSAFEAYREAWCEEGRDLTKEDFKKFMREMFMGYGIC